tara:strand:- start:1851 stop:2984 length:1134 start_codon:yes stop_codon:yes gene_type:complete
LVVAPGYDVITAGINLTRLKLDLLCSGIRIDDSLKHGILPRYRYKRASLSEGRSFILSHGDFSTVINLAVYEKFVRSSPYEYDHKKRLLLKDGEPICGFELTKDPDWYLEKLDDGTMFGSYIQLHGTSVLATSLTNYCVFKDDNEGCSFCGLTLDRDNKKKSPERLASILQAIEKKHPGLYYELNINSGTLRSDDMGAEMFVETLREIRKVSLIAVAAQLAPMKDFKWVDRLKDAGLTSLSFNLEIWDDELRKKIIPGKEKIPKKYYLDILEYAGNIFGGLNVSSWLIGGLEPIESTLKGAEEIAKRGVLPFVTAFRPIIGSTLEDASPTSTDTMIRIYERLKKILEKYDLNPKNAESGCAKCDCCAAGREILAFGI